MSMIQLSEPKTLAEMRAAHRQRQAKFFQPTPRVTFPPMPRPAPKHQGPIESWFDLFIDAAPIQAADRLALSPNEWAMIMELRAKTEHHPAFSEILDLVTARFNVSINDVRSKRRTQHLVRPRHIICYLAKTLTLKSLPEIGRLMGMRDHTTILHSVKKITRLRPNDAQLNDELTWLEGQLAG